MFDWKQAEKLAEVYEGVLLLGTLKGSPSHRVGLRAGDVLLECNGKRIKNVGEFFKARKKGDLWLTVKFVRGGEEREAVLDLSAWTAPDLQQIADATVEMGAIRPPEDDSQLQLFDN